MGRSRKWYPSERRSSPSSFGGFNHIQNSSWSVLVYLKDTKNDDTDSVEGIGSGGPLRVEGKLLTSSLLKFLAIY